MGLMEKHIHILQPALIFPHVTSPFNMHTAFFIFFLLVNFYSPKLP